MTGDRAPRPTALLGALLAGLVLPLVGGCAAATEGAQTCVSWVDFPTPADALADADLVVVGRVVGDAGSVALFGTTARVHRVQVERVVAGDPPAGELEVISTPVTCEGRGPYPGGDPLDVADPVTLFLHHDQDLDRWRTLTPRQGVGPVAPGGQLPATWSG